METADYVEQQQMVKQRFQRRFALSTHAVISSALIALLIAIARSNSEYIYQGWGEFSSYAYAGSPAAVYLVAIGLFTALMTHLIVFRNQESAAHDVSQAATNRRRRRTLFSTHALLAIIMNFAVWAISSDLSRWEIGINPDTGQRIVENFTGISTLAFWVPIIFFLLLIPHAVRVLYVDLLERRLRQADEPEPRAKRKPAPIADEARGTWALGEDGELLFEDETGSAARRR